MFEILFGLTSSSSTKAAMQSNKNCEEKEFREERAEG
jgi:hypothetical protein